MNTRCTRLYFAYGSNLHPLRLGLRVPRCEAVGTAVLDGYRLCFHKRSDDDGSAKADAWQTGDKADQVHGVVYRMSDNEIATLDRIEGLGPGGYAIRTERVSLAAELVWVFLYVAVASHIDATLAPFRWYRDLVWQGARWQGFPADYVAAIAAVSAVDDPDGDRVVSHQRLLAAMPDWRSHQGYRLP